MATYTVQGYRPYNFTSKDTGELIKGMTVFCSFEDEKITGVGVDKFSISDAKLNGASLELGQKIEPLYNKYGKVEEIRTL